MNSLRSGIIDYDLQYFQVVKYQIIDLINSLRSVNYRL